MTDTKQRKKRWLTPGVKLAVTLGLLYFVWYQVRDSLDEVCAALQSLSLPLLSLAFLNHLTGRFLMGWQTSVGLRKHGLDYGPTLLFVINLKTLFFGFFLPGDLSSSAVKWHLISRIEGKRAETLATILYIRLVNLIVVLIIGLGALVLKWPFENRSPLFFGLAALLLLLGVALSIHLRLSQVLWESVRERLPSGGLGRKLKRGLSKLNDALLAFSRCSWKEAGLLWGFSVMIKLSVTFSFWLIALAMGLDVGFVSLLWIHALVEIVQFLPVSFSGIGTREITLIYMFQLIGMSEAAGLSFSLVLLALRFAMVGIGGVFAGISFVSDKDVDRS